MTKLTFRPVPIAVFAVVMFTGISQAQTGGGQTQGTQALQLPLSGRSIQGGSVGVTETAVPGTTGSVNTINSSVQVQGAYGGSVAGRPFSGKLSLREAIQRGLEYNLGATGLAQAARQAHGQSRVARSALLPNVTGELSETVKQQNLQVSGLRIHLPIPGFSIPTIVGPYNYFDLRARVSQTVLDFTALNNSRSSRQALLAADLASRDARDTVVLAVGGLYLQTIAAKARVDSARAQLQTANALFQQALQQRDAGVLARVDADRSEVQALTQKQRVTSLENDFAKQKINLARLIGIPPTDQYELSDDVPFSAAPVLSVEDALKQAYARRMDLKSAEAQVRAAERALAAARAERLPSLAMNADYGAIGVNPSQSHGTFTVAGTLRFSIWEGGRIDGHIEQASAALSQREAELQDLKNQVEADVRKGLLDLGASSSQVEVAKRNMEVAKETLELTRQRFQAGVTNSVEVVQSEESVATAEMDYINSVFAHNISKLSLARAIGEAAQNLPQFLEYRQQ